MPRLKRQTDSRERLLEAAYELFFEQGYAATSVDQIIERAGLTKPTVYSHFPSKEALCVAYLQERRRRVLTQQRREIREAKSAEEGFMATMRLVREAMIEYDFRGCGFFNLVAEIPDPTNPVVIEAKDFSERYREEIREAVIALRDSDLKYAGIDVDRVTETYYLIQCGAIMASQELRELWPLDRAMDDVARLLAGLAES
ncbi:MAG: helix-turn-helix domain-containing protein [Verrucomicrobiota bacterium]